MVFVALTFLVVFAIVIGSYWLMVSRPEDVSKVALKKRLKPVMATRAVRRSLQKAPEKLSSVAALNVLLTRSNSLVAPLQRMIEQSGKKVTVGSILLGAGMLFLGGVLIVWKVTGLIFVAFVVGAVLATLPFIWIRLAARARMRKFEELFPEAIDVITRALRAGHAFTTGLSMVADEMPDPISKEFRNLYDRQNYGLPLADGLREMAANIPIVDVQFFVIAVLTQREAGGNLAEVLENLSAVMRDRFKVKREVRSKSAHGRMTGWILAGMPPALAVAFAIIAPGNMKMLITDPIGIRMIIVALVLQAIGTLVIRRIVDIEY